MSAPSSDIEADDFADVAERLSKRTIVVPVKGSPLLSMTISDEDCWLFC